MLGALAASCVLFIGCLSAQTPGAPPVAATFDGSRAFDHLKQLVAIGPHPAGSEESKKRREYIKQQLGANA